MGANTSSHLRNFNAIGLSHKPSTLDNNGSSTSSPCSGSLVSHPRTSFPRSPTTRDRSLTSPVAAAAANCSMTNNNNMNPFTADDKQLIRLTWSELQQQKNGGATDRGVRVFLRIFALAPEAQSLFRDFGGLHTPAELAANSVFRSHATRFMTAVDMTVRSLDALELVVIPTLIRLGRCHLAFAGFHPRYMDVFEAAMEDIWRRDIGRRRYRGATRRVWRKMFRFLTSRVTDGYMEALDAVRLSPASGSAVVGVGCCPHEKQQQQRTGESPASSACNLVDAVTETDV